MTKIRAVMFNWNDEAKVMIPQPRFLPLCGRQYVDNEGYALAPVENVSGSSRGGFFASINNAWDSLPENDTRFPTREHLRKRALVAAGWATHAQFVMDTPADAAKMARGLRRVDEYAVIKVGANVVDLWTAKSIAQGQITAEEWKEVKPRALDFVTALSGTTRAALENHMQDGGSR